jgi:hypothetical protein
VLRRPIETTAEIGDVIFCCKVDSSLEENYVCSQQEFGKLAWIPQRPDFHRPAVVPIKDTLVPRFESAFSHYHPNSSGEDFAKARSTRIVTSEPLCDTNVYRTPLT